MENLMRSSPTECRASGRTGRECLKVLCDGNMNVKIKGKVYITVVRPALVYGVRGQRHGRWRGHMKGNWRSQKWVCNDGLAELRSWTNIRNERIRGTTKVGEIAKKGQERIFRWYGHVMRRDSIMLEGGRWKWKHRVEGTEEDLREDGWTK